MKFVNVDFILGDPKIYISEDREKGRYYEIELE
jgi:hypothetical protein